MQASCYQPLIDDKIVMHLKTDDQLMELNLLRKKLQETENAMAKIIAQMGNASLKSKVSFFLFNFCSVGNHCN